LFFGGARRLGRPVILQIALIRKRRRVALCLVRYNRIIRPRRFWRGDLLESTVVVALKGGAFAFLVKPFDDEEFLDAVRGALGEPD
jgi:hypothetical protein